MNTVNEEVSAGSALEAAVDRDPEVLDLSDPVEDELRAEGAGQASLDCPAAPKKQKKPDIVPEPKKKPDISPVKTTLKTRLNLNPIKADFAALSGRSSPWTKPVSWAVELASALPSTGCRLPESMEVEPSGKGGSISTVWDQAFARITTLKPRQQVRIWENYQKLVASSPVVPFVPPRHAPFGPATGESSAAAAAAAPSRRPSQEEGQNPSGRRPLQERHPNLPAPKGRPVTSRLGRVPAAGGVRNESSSSRSSEVRRESSSRSKVERKGSSSSRSKSVSRAEGSSSARSASQAPKKTKSSSKGTAGSRTSEQAEITAPSGREKSIRRSEKSTSKSVRKTEKSTSKPSGKTSTQNKVSSAKGKARAAAGVVRNRSLPNKPPRDSPPKKADKVKKKASRLTNPVSRSRIVVPTVTVKKEPEESGQEKTKKRVSVHDRLGPGPSWFAKELRLPLQGNVPQDELLRLNGSDLLGTLRTRRRRQTKTRQLLRQAGVADNDLYYRYEWNTGPVRKRSAPSSMGETGKRMRGCETGRTESSEEDVMEVDA